MTPITIGLMGGMAAAAKGYGTGFDFFFPIAVYDQAF